VIITAEAIAASAVVLLASATLWAYLADWIGLAIAPSPILVMSLAAAAATLGGLWRRSTRDHASLAAFVIIVAAILAWLLWLAGPDSLPPGTGPDLTHHLLLIGYIDQHWSLPHDPQLGAYLGEMLDYTPGAHLLAALAGAWTRTDGLHAVYPLVALTVALKSGIVFLITRRLVGGDASRVPFAVASTLLLLLPRAYFIGSFTQHSFLAQVVAETFAVALWWALIVWDSRPAVMPIVFFAIVGAATFLTWPVWIGPPLVVLAMCVASRRDVGAVDRAKQFTLAVGSIGAVAAAFTASRGRSAGIVAVAGYVLRPAPAVFGWAFLLVCGAGVCVGLFGRRTRTIPLFLGAIILQAGALFVLAQARGAATPYLALKMVYLAIYPLAVAGAVGVAAVWQLVFRRAKALRHLGQGGTTVARGSTSVAQGSTSVLQGSTSVAQGSTSVAQGSTSVAQGSTGVAQGSTSVAQGFSPAFQAALAWTLVGLFGIATARGVAAVPRPTPTLSERLLQAGRWARAHVNPGCVDYLVADSYSAYWLHLAVLGNARSTSRSIENDTYEPRSALVRWIEPGGLPYAIAEDFSELPKDIRESVDVVARFGPAAVVKRHGPSSCAP